MNRGAGGRTASLNSLAYPNKCVMRRLDPTAFAQLIVLRAEGDMKVGNFSFTVVDVEVPLSGVPIRVTGTYDTRRKAESLDDGFGWWGQGVKSTHYVFSES